jgi:hypothetical protein
VAFRAEGQETTGGLAIVTPRCASRVHAPTDNFVRKPSPTLQKAILDSLPF